MTVLADKLRKMRIFNTHGLLTRFGDDSDVAVSYSPPEPHRCMAASTHVWSALFKTDPKAAWYDYGKKSFVGKRAESVPAAMAWAEKTYGIKKWAPCPFRGGYVPKHILDRAKAAVRAMPRSAP